MLKLRLQAPASKATSSLWEELRLDYWKHWAPVVLHAGLAHLETCLSFFLNIFYAVSCGLSEAEAAYVLVQ